jgi:hypothetical protein
MRKSGGNLKERGRRMMSTVRVCREIQERICNWLFRMLVL